MNTTKSYKFILLITALVMSVITAFTMMSFNTAKADGITITPNAYFNYNGTTTAEFKNDNAVFTLTENDTIEIENTVTVNDFFINYKIGEGVESVKLLITANSYLVNGNKSTDGKYYTDIVNQVSVSADGTAKLNDKDLTTATAGKIYMKVDGNGYYTASVDGTDFVTEDNSYYRVKTSNEYNKLTGKVKIEVTLKDGVDTADFEIISLSQKASDDAFLQTFKLTESALTEVMPVICLTDDIKVKDGKAVIYNTITKITYNVYSFLDGHNKNNTKLTANAWVNENGNGEVHFVTVGANQLKIVDKADDTKVFLTVELNVLEEGAASDKPVYTFEQSAYDAFMAALEKQYLVVDDKDTSDVADDETHCVALGTTITIPSLKDFVSDDYTSYENLGVEMYYATPNSTSFATKNEMKITLSDAGNYTFFVLFKDKNNADCSMDKGDFIIEEDGQVDKINESVYGKQFIFSFHIEDDAPITITPSTVQGKGYKGASYTASKFTVDASGCTITYKLYYNSSMDADKDADGWVEIPSASSVTDTEYNENGYSYDDVKEIAYNGTLTFTPDKIGSYKIECYANSKMTAREASASTIIRIGNEPSVVKPASEWLQNNVWSVVFLSIGTLCLIGIIVLLCIKPKEENDN